MEIRDVATKEVIGRVVTNRSLSFDEAMSLAGFAWIERDNDAGWSNDGGKTIYDDSSAEMDYSANNLETA